MDFDDKILTEFSEVKSLYSNLVLFKGRNGNWKIIGNLHFKGKFKSTLIEDQYSIEILIPADYPNNIPDVQSIDGRIPKTFHSNGNYLCLGAPLAVKINFYKTSTLLGFVQNCLIPYLANHSYFISNGVLLFGELSHGIEGIIEHLQGLLETRSYKVIIALLKTCLSDPIPRLYFCPCRSGKRIKKCHLPTLEIVKKYLSEKEIREMINNIEKYRQMRVV